MSYQELSRVRHQSKQRNPKEFFINVHTLQHDIDSVDQDLRDNGIENSGAQQDDGTLCLAPVWSVMTTTTVCRLRNNTNILVLLTGRMRLGLICRSATVSACGGRALLG